MKNICNIIVLGSLFAACGPVRAVSFPARDFRACDVVVCGGGPAGCAAAIAAGRSGLDVLLVEAQSRLGGTATSGGVSHWLGGRNDAGEWVVGGLFRELSLRAEKECAAILPKHPEGKTYQPYAWLPWFIHGVVLDSDRVAMMLDGVMEEERVEVLLETRVVGVEKSGERITHVVTHSKDGFRRIPAKAVIDATGDADVAAFAGCPVLAGRDGDHLTTPASLTFHLSHVDGKALWDEIERTREPKFRPLIEELKRKGEWPFLYDIFISVKGLADDEVMINTMRLTEIDGTDAESRTKGYVRGRREAYRLLDILRKHFPGFKDAQMKSIAPMLGVRETRRIDGAFKLMVEDLRTGTEFPDTIGYSMYGWDLPDPKRPSVQPLVDESGGGFVNKAKKQLVTPIPYRVMVPRGCANLLCPGRAISVERDVLGPLRVMAPCMAMGEACGAAAKQIADGAANSEVDVPALLAELRRRGCIVDKSALPVVRPRTDPETGDKLPFDRFFAAMESSGDVAESSARRVVAKDSWHGFDREVFEFNGCEAWIVEPKTVADGRPWAWIMEWPGAFAKRTGSVALLKAGYHVVTFRPGHYEKGKFVSRPGNMNDRRLCESREFQRYLVDTLHFAPKANLIGMSWGGFYSVRYAATYPDAVSRIYLDAPLLDFSTAAGKESWNLNEKYGVDAKTYVGRDDPRQPVNMYGPIAKAGIPILLLYGGADATVPPSENCLRFAEAFKAAGGDIEIVARGHYGHHPHGLEIDEQQRFVDFFNGINAKQ